MQEKDEGLDLCIARRVRGLRSAQGFSLDSLASRSGVSRSMISLIERGESSPTAAILNRLAMALGVALASLFAEEEDADASPLARRTDQATWRDPETGYLRRRLSPLGYPSSIELVEILLPVGARVAYDNAGSMRPVRINQQVWVTKGQLELTVGEVAHDLHVGDCLAMDLDQPIVFRNLAGCPTRYLVALATEAAGMSGPNEMHPRASVR